MPKEITHWIIAERVAKKLQGTVYEQAINKYPNIYKLGAVYHDLFYYLTPQKYPKHQAIAQGLASVTNKLHGISGEDTFAVLRCVAWQIQRQAENQHLIAFWLGLLTHIIADQIFHPLVYYYTGEYYPDTDIKTRIRHQRHHLKFEALLDFYLCKGNYEEMNKYDLTALVKGLEYRFDDLVQQALAFYLTMNAEVYAKHMLTALAHAHKAHRQIRSLSRNSFFAPLFSFFPQNMQTKLGALYYKQLNSYFERLSGELAFKNPVTGQTTLTTIEEMLNLSVENCIAYCQKWQNSIFGVDSWDFPEKGHSLEHNQPPGKTYTFAYYEAFFEDYG